MDKTVSSKTKLDWSRLLGFDQANPDAADSLQLGRTGAKAGTKIAGQNGLADARLTKLGAKVGNKPGAKLVRRQA